MPYAIMRFEKIKTAAIGSLAGSLAHTFRSRYTPNAAPELTKNNHVWLGPETPQGVADAIRERWPEKRRKDAVGVIEHFIGASPEFFKKHGGNGDEEAYFRGAIEWLKSHYGEENVISVVQHNDETSPHLAAYVVPLDPETGRLNAKKWTGGRGACAAMQTSFQAFAGEPVGLERGVRGSKAEHTSISRWYAGQTDLDKRARSVRFDEADVAAREAEIVDDTQQIETRTRRLDAQDLQLQRRRNELDDQESAVAEKASSVAAERLKLDEATKQLVERESAARALSERAERLHKAAKVREHEAAERERRLFALERELRERDDKLSDGERALEQRQKEIDRAGAQLRTRLSEAKEHQERWEQQKTAWLDANRPPEVPDIVRHLEHLQTLGTLDAAIYLDEQDSSELFEAFSPTDGLTSQGRAVLEQHKGNAERRQLWERDIEPPSSPAPGLG